MDFMLGDLANKLRPLGQLEILDSVSRKTLEYLGDTPGDELSSNGLILRAKGLQIIGEVNRSQGESEAALEALGRARTILMRQHRLAPRDVQVLKNLGENAFWTGIIYRDQNRWQAANDAWRNYQAFADQLHQIEPGNLEWLLEQSYALNTLGSLAQARGLSSQAAAQFLKSIALKQAALKGSSNTRTIQGELADSYSWLASAKESLGELNVAQQLYAIEMDMVLRLREQSPNDARLMYYQMRALRHRAVLGMALGNDTQALHDFDEAVRLFSPLVRSDPKNRTWQMELACLTL
jgi:hypothetical protein